MVLSMLFNKPQKTEPQGQMTHSNTKKKTDPDRYAIQVPMTSYQNHEKLDYQSLRKLCETDWRKHRRCIMCNGPQNRVDVCEACGSAKYCSWECKADDQLHHALVCAQWASFQTSPSKTAGRILIFPAQSTTPVFAWADLVRNPDEDSPLLTFAHPEVPDFTRNLTATTPFSNSKLARMGCINECRAIARTKHRLGHGLFVLEWTPPALAKISTTCINQSIQSITGLLPGQTWLWTGPITIIALDITHTSAKIDQYTLSNITLRDVRHAIDFFTLNLRNAAVPRPLPTTTNLAHLGLPPPNPSTATASNSLNRFPFPTLPAIKLNEPHTPLAHILGITSPMEEIHVSRYIPHPTRAYEGVSAVCAALGLAWVVRVVLVHGAELDWGYDGFFEADTTTATAAGGGGGGSRSGYGSASSESESPDSGLPSESASSDSGPPSESRSVTTEGGGKNDEAEEKSIPAQLDLVFAVDEATGGVEGKKLPRTGDGMVFVHAGGQRLRKEHVQALVAFVKKGCVDRNCRLADEKLEKEFRRFWKEFRAKEKIPADVPSPYNLTPALSGMKTGDRFLLCREVFKELILRTRPEVKLLAGGLCVRR